MNVYEMCLCHENWRGILNKNKRVVAAHILETLHVLIALTCAVLVGF